MNLKIRDNLLIQSMRLLNKAGALKIKHHKDIDAHKSRGILVVVTTALGDAIFCTPLFRALRKALPDTKIGLLVHHSFQDLFSGDENLDVIIPYYGKFKKVYSTWRHLKEDAFDIALVANMNDPDVIPLLYWSGIRAMIRRPWKSTIYPYLISNPEMMGSGDPPDHAIPLNLKMAEIVGLKPEAERTYISVNAESQAGIANLLHDFGIGDDELLIGFHPGASLRSKMWPPESYAELGKNIIARYPRAKIILTGGNKESPLCLDIQKKIGAGAFSVAGKLPLKELAALIQRFTLFVSGDTGPFHIANALGIRTVTIFGPSDDKTNGPIWDLDIHRVITNKPGCWYDNCARWCKEPVCITDIPVDIIYKACRGFLDTKSC
jgi:ADP-heptose:LPS heptosyltransferase